MDNVKMYFKGDSGIKSPTDMLGNPISIGDLLTRDFGDNEKYNIETKEYHKTEPFYIVKQNDNGGYYAESIEPFNGLLDSNYYYLHDFRFKYCLKIN